MTLLLNQSLLLESKSFRTEAITNFSDDKALEILAKAQSNKPQLTCPYKTAQNVKELIDAWLTDPTAMSDDCVPLLVRDSIKWNRWVLPWRNGERKLNNLYQNFNPIVVDFLAAELATKSKLSAQQEINHAIAVMNTWEKTKGGWTNLMQRYQQALQTEKQQPLPQQHIALAPRANNITSNSLENVPRYQNSQSFSIILQVLESEGYSVDYSVVNMADFGLPQARRRLVLIASRGFRVAIPPLTENQ